MLDARQHTAEHSLRMADLVERTGVSAQTIRYYVNQGLLPQPRKSARNMAWYSETHVEQIRLIRALQKEHFLPLVAIRAALHESDDYPLTRHQRQLIGEARQRILNRRKPSPAAALGVVARELGISADDLAELRQQHLLSGATDDAESDIAILRIWAVFQRNGLDARSGFRPRDLAAIHDVIDLLFDREMRIFSAHLGDLPVERVDTVLSEAVPAISDLIGILNERRIARYAARFPDDPTEE
ncbi:MAG: MerR family transcriptional regulator [Oceanococcaceae bacterium]